MADGSLIEAINTEDLRKCANTVRGLAMDAVQRANSGHPGLPMGMADAAVVLWSQFMCHAFFQKSEKSRKSWKLPPERKEIP